MARVLVLDFDGTLTRFDVGDGICDRFAPPEWREIDDRWIRREIALPDAQRQMWALVRGGRREILDWLDGERPLREGLDELLAGAASLGVELWLASGGFDFYIEHLLGGRMDRFARRFYSRARFEGGGVRLDFPDDGLACGSCGVCKGRVCDLARAGGKEVLFAGDGSSDRCALGRGARVAAVRGSMLAGWCRERGEPAFEFDRLDELLRLLSGNLATTRVPG